MNRVPARQIHVVVDGRIFSLQRHGGISRFFLAVLPRACDQEPNLRITILRGALRGPLPEHERISVRRILPVERLLRPGRVWLGVVSRLRPWLLVRAVQAKREAIWQPTYGGAPGGWRGPRLAIVYDLIGELYKSLYRGAALRQTEQFNREQRAAVVSAQRVLCISKSTMQDAIALYGFDGRRARLVPLATSERFQVRSTGAGRSTFLLYVGSRFPYKNFPVVLEALASLDRGVRLVAIGAPPSREEAALVQALDLSERVDFRPSCSDDELCSLYNQAVAFVYSSFYEGFGIPLLEAMACGCPIVSSRIPSSLEVAGACPRYFDPKSREELVLALRDALAEGRQSSRVAAGLERAREFSWDRSASALVSVYRELTGEAHGNSH